MLDDINFIVSKDPHDALGVAAAQPAQATWMANIQNSPNNLPVITNVVMSGMGGSALAGGLAQSWLRLSIPFEVDRGYSLPHHVGAETLVVVSSYSGNTEEEISSLEDAETRGANIVIIASGGQLIDIAQEKHYPFVQLPTNYQPRMAVTLELRALVKLFEQYDLVSGKYDEIANTSDWLIEQSQSWLPDVPGPENLAKQLAEHSAGKTPVVYSGLRMAPVGYKWKISFNENAKNVAFCNQLPEFNHNEFIGWTSHPVDKPYAIFDLISGFEHPQILRRFGVTDRLLSGMRPKSVTIELQGESVVAQMLWGCLLGDFVSIYLAILNGVDPTKVDLIETFKQEIH